jgi:hypothetical protein
VVVVYDTGAIGGFYKVAESRDHMRKLLKELTFRTKAAANYDSGDKFWGIVMHGLVVVR